MKIFKYDLELTDRQTIELPANAEILSVGDQRGVLRLWAKVNPENPPEPVTINIYGTGQDMEEDNYTFLGTVRMKSGYVWHIFHRT